MATRNEFVARAILWEALGGTSIRFIVILVDKQQRFSQNKLTFAVNGSSCSPRSDGRLCRGSRGVATRPSLGAIEWHSTRRFIEQFIARPSARWLVPLFFSDEIDALGHALRCLYFLVEWSFERRKRTCCCDNRARMAGDGGGSSWQDLWLWKAPGLLTTASTWMFSMTHVLITSIYPCNRNSHLTTLVQKSIDPHVASAREVCGRLRIAGKRRRREPPSTIRLIKTSSTQILQVPPPSPA